MRLLKKLLLSLFAVVLIIEEWLWEILTRLGARLARLLHLQKFEAWLARCPPHLALLAFIIPVLAVAPINLLGFVLMAYGKILHGVLVEIGAKLLGTLLVARVFKLTKPQLLTFRWFQILYEKITGWLAWAHARLAATTAYRTASAIKAKIKRLSRRA